MSPENSTPASGTYRQHRPRRVPGRVDHLRSRCRRPRCAARRQVARCSRVGMASASTACRRRGAAAPGRRALGQFGRDGDVVVVTVRAHDRAITVRPADRVDDRRRRCARRRSTTTSSSSPTSQMLLSTSQVPPSRLNVPEVTTRSIRSAPLTARPPSAAPSRRASCANAASTSSSRDALGDELLQRQPALPVQVDQHREVPLGQAVAVPRRLQRPAAGEEVDQRHLERHLRGRHADQHHGAGQVAGVERLLPGLGPADRIDHHVGAEAVGQLLDRLDGVGLGRR